MANSVYDDKVPGEAGLGDESQKPLGDPSTPLGGKPAAGGDPLAEVKKGESAGDAGGGSDGDAESAGGLASREFGLGKGIGGARVLPKGFSPALDRMEKLSGFLDRHKKKGLIGGGAVGVIASLTLLLFFIMIPLKIESIVKGLENHFMASSNNAVETETQNMLEKYMTKHVLPSYKRCGTTLSKDCSVSIATSTNPVTTMYQAWANNKLETQLATMYGIEFKYDTQANVWHLIAPGTPKDGDVIGANGEGLHQEFTKRSEFRAATSDALKGITGWEGIRLRFQVGRLLEEKYGVNRCNAYCGDKVADFKDQKSKTAQLYLVQKVLQPRNASLGIVMECLISACAAQDTQPTTPEDGVSGELQGAPENPDTDAQIRTALTQLASTRGLSDATDIDKMVQDYKDISDGGYQNYALNKVLDKIGLSEFTNQVADSVSAIGWINKLATLINGAHLLGPDARKGNYIVNAPADVSTFETLATEADEIHTGHVDAAEVGSFVDILGSGKKVGGNDPVGGTASAEQSPLYGAIFNQDKKGSSSDYKCGDDNDSSVPKGKLICPESSLGQGVGAADSVSSFLNTPGISVISGVAGLIKGFTGIFSDLLGSIISHFPGVGSLENLVNSFIQPVFKAAVNKLIPNPFGNGNLSGGRSLELAGVGAEVVGKDSCIQIGCLEGSAAVATNIINQQKADEQQQQDLGKSYFARMFDTDSSSSLVTKLALDIPSDPQSSVRNGLASLLSNPFGNLFKGFGSLIHGQASADPATPDSADPANIGASYYPAGDIPADGEDYWNANNCGDTGPDGPTAKWQQAASDTKNPNTGMPKYTTTNPCLLVQQSASAGGSKLNTSLLSSDERQVLNGGSSSTVSSGGTDTTGGATDDTKKLAQQILDAQKSGKVSFAIVNPANSNDNSTAEDNIKDMAAGNPAQTSRSCSGGVMAPNKTAQIDSKLLQFIIDLSNTTSFTINELVGGCHDESTSNHYAGKAVDFGCPFDAAAANTAGEKYSISDGTGETCSSGAGHYHYSIGGN